MCGIAGSMGLADGAAVRRMTERLRHRGPDGRGVTSLEGGDVHFGHTRLSILDLSERGAQPMESDCGRFTITFNGEIDNFRELRKRLEEKRGASFRSDTDTEVILAGYREWGVGMLKRLRGMFAFAIWDDAEKSLFLARDRFGIKPLIYAESGAAFLFASEISALLASREVPALIDETALFQFLAFGSVIQPRTMIRGARHLEAGTWMKRSAGGKVESGRYWDLATAGEGKMEELAGLSFEEQIEATEAKLDEACRYHLVADVPVGSFLSGGLDSSLITAMLARHVSGKMRTFSLGFTDQSDLSDELSDARVAADVIGTEHDELVLRNEDVPDLFDGFVRSVDQPSSDGFNTFLISGEAARDLKVVTSGLGADELFGGYSHFQTHQKLAGGSAWPWDRMCGLVYEKCPNRVCYGGYLRSRSNVDRMLNLRRLNLDVDLQRILAGRDRRIDFLSGFKRRLHEWMGASDEIVRRLSYVECRHYLQSTLLRDSDVLSMANGLELRPIFLDHELAELAFALPPSAKADARTGKRILREMARKALPEEVLTRPKRGFDLPVAAWMRTSLDDRLRDALNAPITQSIFPKPYLQRFQQDRARPRVARQGWALLVLISWLQDTGCVLDSEPAKPTARVA